MDSACSEEVDFIQHVYCRECRRETAEQEQEKQNNTDIKPPSPNVDVSPIKPDYTSLQALKRELLLQSYRSFNEPVAQDNYTHNRISSSQACDEEDPSRTNELIVLGNDDDNSNSISSPQQAEDKTDQSSSVSAPSCNSISPGIIQVVNVSQPTDPESCDQQIDQQHHISSQDFTLTERVRPITTQSLTVSQPSLDTTLVTSSGKQIMPSVNNKVNRNKKRKYKQTTPKRIKFHEYKGPPDVTKTKTVTLMETDGPGCSSGLPYISIQQQQMTLRLQLQFQQKKFRFIQPAPEVEAEAQTAIASAAADSISNLVSSSATLGRTSPENSATSLTNSNNISVSRNTDQCSNKTEFDQDSHNSSVSTALHDSSDMEELLVANLKAELMSRISLPLGTKPQLIERPRPHGDTALANIKKDRLTPLATNIGSVIGDSSLMLPPDDNRFVNMNSVTKYNTQFDDPMNTSSHPISPTNSTSHLNSSLSTPVSPNSKDITGPLTFNLGGGPLIRSQFTTNLSCVPMEQLSQPPLVTPVDKSEMYFIQTETMSPRIPSPPHLPPSPMPKVIQAPSPKTAYRSPNLESGQLGQALLYQVTNLQNMQELLPQAPCPQTVENMTAHVQQMQNLMQQKAPMPLPSSSSSSPEKPGIMPAIMVIPQVISRSELIAQQQNQIEKLQEMLDQSQLQLKEAEQLYDLSGQREELGEIMDMASSSSDVTNQYQLSRQSFTSHSSMPKQQQETISQPLILQPHQIKQETDTDDSSHSYGLTNTQIDPQHAQEAAVQTQIQTQHIEQEAETDMKTVVTSRGESAVQNGRPLLATLIHKLKEKLNVNKSKVLPFAKTLPGVQHSVFTPKSEQLDNVLTPKSEQLDNDKEDILTISNNHDNKESHRISSEPASPIGNEVTTTSSSVFFNNIPNKEPPNYEETIKNKQNLLLKQVLQEVTSGGMTEASKSQALDDLLRLEMLLCNYEPTPSAAEEPHTSCEDTHTATISVPPEATNAITSFMPSLHHQVYTTPLTYTNTTSFTNNSVITDSISDSVDSKITPPVGVDRNLSPPICVISTVSSIPTVETTRKDLNSSFSESNTGDSPFIALDWSDTDIGLDLHDGPKHGKVLSPHNLLNIHSQSLQRDSGIDGSELSSNSLESEQDDQDANDEPCAMNMGVSDWLNVVMPSTGMTALNAGAPLSFPSNPVLTSTQDILDLLGVDESGSPTSTPGMHSGLNPDKFEDT